MCPSHPEEVFFKTVYLPFNIYFALSKWMTVFFSEIHSVLIHGSFIEISLKYFVFTSSVEICIYMFNKTRYDLLLSVLLSLQTHCFITLVLVFTVRAEGRLKERSSTSEVTRVCICEAED